MKDNLIPLFIDHVCNPNPCIHGGTCKPKKNLQNNWDFNCTCPKIFKGIKCEGTLALN